MATRTIPMNARRRTGPVRDVWHEVYRYRLAYLFLLPALLVLAFVDLLPMARGVKESFYLHNLFRPGDQPYVGTEQYRDLLEDDLFRKAFWNTWYYTLGSVACQFVLGMSAAVLLNQSVRFRGLFRGIILIPWVVPGSLAAMMFGLLFTSTGLVNTFLDKIGFTRLGIIDSDYAWLSNTSTAMPTIIITNMWKGFPFFAVMFLAAMQTIPSDLYEAATIDGASSVQSFFHITIPSIRPTILITTLLGTLWTFNSLDLIYILTYGGPFYATLTLPMWAYQQAFGRGYVGQASALAVIILVIMAVVTTAYLAVYRRAMQNNE
ncbi:MAG: multiple sugar transport system permease protein [Thermomicrobiales bacterium]|nr:multiple sugar transport system permease protein [Thermomicrobiales bacterium]